MQRDYRPKKAISKERTKAKRHSFQLPGSEELRFQKVRGMVRERLGYDVSVSLLFSNAMTALEQQIGRGEFRPHSDAYISIY